MRKRYRQMGSLYDDAYNAVTGAVGTVTNDVESAGRWVGQEFNTFDNYVGQTVGMPFATDPNTGAPEIWTPPDTALAGQIAAPITGAISNTFYGALMLAGIAFIAYGLIEGKK